jgi:hypothetical protein
VIDISNLWGVRSVLFHRIVPGLQIFVQFITNVEIRWIVVLIGLGVFSIYANVNEVVGSIFSM